MARSLRGEVGDSIDSFLPDRLVTDEIRVAGPEFGMPVPADMLPLRDPVFPGTAAGQSLLLRVAPHLKLSSLGRVWLRSGSKDGGAGERWARK